MPNVYQFSVGIQRELPFRISLEVTYAGSRSNDIEGNFGGYNEPSAAFQAQCDVTLGGSRSLCDQQVTNPYFNVAGFEGTTRFTSPTLSRFELARPFPAFSGCNIGTTTNCFSMNQQNLGKMQYDSLQFVANKRLARGVTINAGYTWVPRWTEDRREHDDRKSTTPMSTRCRCSRTTAHTSRTAEHRITASGVWELPWYRDQRSIKGYLLGGWSIAPAFVYQSGQPWDMPGNVDLAPGVDLNNVALPGKKDGQFIYGVKPCVGQRNAATGRYDLISVSQAYGCTEPYFLIRETFQRRTAMFRYDEFRRPSFWQVDVNFAKTTPITQTSAVPGASGGVQPLQQPDVRRAQLQPDDDVGGLRPHQPQHHGPVELPAVHPAGIPVDLLSSRGRERASVAFPVLTARLRAQGSGKIFE